MKENENYREQSTLKLNLTLPMSLYEKIKDKSSSEHLPMATYVKQLLMKNLIDGDNSKEKLSSENGNFK